MCKLNCIFGGFFIQGCRVVDEWFLVKIVLGMVFCLFIEIFRQIENWFVDGWNECFVNKVGELLFGDLKLVVQCFFDFDFE